MDGYRDIRHTRYFESLVSVPCFTKCVGKDTIIRVARMVFPFLRYIKAASALSDRPL